MSVPVCPAPSNPSPPSPGRLWGEITKRRTMKRYGQERQLRVCVSCAAGRLWGEITKRRFAWDRCGRDTRTHTHTHLHTACFACCCSLAAFARSSNARGRADAWPEGPVSGVWPLSQSTGSAVHRPVLRAWASACRTKISKAARNPPPLPEACRAAVTGCTAAALWRGCRVLT